MSKWSDNLKIKLGGWAIMMSYNKTFYLISKHTLFRSKYTSLYDTLHSYR